MPDDVNRAIIKFFEKTKKIEEISKLIPYSWGGRLEEFYEDTCCKLNNKDISDEDFEMYNNILIKFDEQHPEVRAWSYKNCRMFN